MPSITIILSDTPTGGVSVHSSFEPAVGKPCSPAQSTALEIIRRTRKEWGTPAVQPPAQVSVYGRDIDAVHRTRDRVVSATVKEVAP